MFGKSDKKKQGASYWVLKLDWFGPAGEQALQEKLKGA